ncbi:MAG: radical SAM protein, partial [Candidatus Paceibacterota bacterium]
MVLKAKQNLKIFLLNKIEKRMEKDVIAKNPDDRPSINRQYRAAMGRNALRHIRQRITDNTLNPNSEKALTKVLLNSIFFGSKEAKKFTKKYGFRPPKFITMGILAWCNLNCYGCYANAARDELLAKGKSASSWMQTGEHVLSFDAMNRIINDAKKNFGARFFVITGGEPFFYRSQGHDIYDFFAKHKDCYFLVYTNGV